MVLPDRFDGTSPEPVQAGAVLTIKFCNASMAGQTVTVGVSNGEGASTTVQITLGADGCGTTEWDVPGVAWDLVILSHPTSIDHAVAVDHADA